MRFAEAMSLGLPEIHFSNLTFLEVAKSEFAPWYFPKGTDKECIGCLVGAALYAVGEKQSHYPDYMLQKHWPWINGMAREHCPFCTYSHNYLSSLATCIA